MGRKVKCQFCGEFIEQEDAFCENKLTKAKKYYCNETHFKNADKYAYDLFWATPEYRNAEKEYANKILEWFSDAYGQNFSHNGFSIIKKEWKLWNQTVHNCDIYDYLTSNSDYLTRTMQKKSFASEYGWVRYISAIIKNHCKRKQKINIGMQSFYISSSFDEYEPRKTIRKKRIGLAELGG